MNVRKDRVKLTDEEGEAIREKLECAYKKSLISEGKLVYSNDSIEDFIEYYNNNIKEKLNERSCRVLFQKMYHSNNKTSLKAFEYFISDSIYFSRHFTRNILKNILNDEENVRNDYKAIIIKCIKKHPKKLEIYERIRKYYNMKYFFKKVKEIERIDKIKQF